jgi:hypothetical protein
MWPRKDRYSTRNYNIYYDDVLDIIVEYENKDREVD